MRGLVFGMHYTQILESLNAAGHQAYIVGGYVRDMLLNIKVADPDIDIATSALPQEVLDLVGGKYVSAAQAYPVVYVGKVQVATFRKDTPGADRHDANSIVVGATLEDDAMRRDFTINAIYQDVSFNIKDPTGRGVNDLRCRLICFVGNAEERIAEDPLRVFRAVRFATRFKHLGFKLSDSAMDAIKSFKLWKEVEV